MTDNGKDKYDVFISYAHADAQTDDGKALVKEIKSAIETALGGRYVFLDSEALKWGDEWSAKIRKCIDNCRVFVYLLSPNYLHSDYCQREKLWWARRETMLGRLNKDTLPIYYIALPKTEESALMQYGKEHRICQTDGRPFFESVDQVKSDIAHERVREIRESLQGVADIKKLVEAAEVAEIGDCTIYPPISRFFVGRLKELAELHEMCCEKRTIPVISGAAGIGKSELAVAYAYAYAENFPQGRFMIPMQGVENWTTAMDKMVEKIRECDESPTEWGFPENFSKLPPEERLRSARGWLRNRAKLGSLLLVLDNLEDMELISDAGLAKLTGVAGLPDDLHIIATTRLNEKPNSGWNARKFYELGRLSDKDAMEFFCLVGENVFPFAKWPMSDDGKILLSKNLPDKKTPSGEEIAEIEAEYAAAKEVVSLLGGHAWSLEIVAGFMANNPNYSFRRKRKELDENPLEELRGETLRGGDDLQYPEILLRPTLDQLRKFDEIDEELGQHMLFLATVASFFPPEQVPEEALAGIWEREFGDKELSWNGGMRREPSSCKFALDQLKRHRIINGDGPLLKMHRLTSEVLQNSLDEENKLAIFESMRQYLERFLDETPYPSAEQLLPWDWWACLLLFRSHLLHDSLFSVSLNSIYRLSERFLDVGLYNEAELLLGLLTVDLEDDKPNFAAILRLLGDLHFEVNRVSKAETEYRDALNIFREIANKDPEFSADVAGILGRLAVMHKEQNHIEEAEKEYLEELTIYRELAKTDPEKYKFDLSRTLNQIAIFHGDQNRLAESEKEYLEALAIRRELAESNPEEYKSNLAGTLDCLAIFHEDQNRIEEAEKEYLEALTIRRELAKKIPGKYNSDLARALTNLAIIHRDRNRIAEAEKEYQEVLKIWRGLVKTNPEKYSADLAGTLNSLAVFHDDQNCLAESEKEFQEALEIYAGLAKNNPEKYNYVLARVLNSIASVHYMQNRVVKAEAEYRKSLSIYRTLEKIDSKKYNAYAKMPLDNLVLVANNFEDIAKKYSTQGHYDKAAAKFGRVLKIYETLAEIDPEKYTPKVAEAYGNMAFVHEKQNCWNKAEGDYRKALEIYRDLNKSNPAVYNDKLADILFFLANMHHIDDRLDEAEREYLEALSIMQTLSDIDPKRYEDFVANMLDCLAILHVEQTRMEEAEDDIQNLLTIRRSQAKTDPQKCSGALAKALYDLAGLHQDQNRLDDARAEYAEAMKIARQYPNDPLCRQILEEGQA